MGTEFTLAFSENLGPVLSSCFIYISFIFVEFKVVMSLPLVSTNS